MRESYEIIKRSEKLGYFHLHNKFYWLVKNYMML